MGIEVIGVAVRTTTAARGEAAKLLPKVDALWVAADPVVLADEAAVRTLLAKHGLPTIPGSDGVVPDIAAALAAAERIGYPVIAKASAGGGGRGMRIARDVDEFAKSFSTAKSEAMAAFNNDTVYVEKYLERPRHIEFQVLGDSHGNVIHLGERDCSIQRRHQKLIEEAPAPFIPARIRNRLWKAAVDAAKGSLAQAEARWETSKANLARVRPLAEKNAVSQKDLDDAVSAEQIGAAGYRAPVVNLELSFKRPARFNEQVEALVKAIRDPGTDLAGVKTLLGNFIHRLSFAAEDQVEIREMLLRLLHLVQGVGLLLQRRLNLV